MKLQSNQKREELKRLKHSETALKHTTRSHGHSEVATKPSSKGTDECTRSSSDLLKSVDEVTRTTANFLQREQILQEKIRHAQGQLENRKNLSNFFQGLTQKVNIGVGGLLQRVARSDLPIPNHRTMLRSNNLPINYQMQLL